MNFLFVIARHVHSNKMLEAKATLIHFVTNENAICDNFVCKSVRAISTKAHRWRYIFQHFIHFSMMNFSTEMFSFGNF